MSSSATSFLCSDERTGTTGEVLTHELEACTFARLAVAFVTVRGVRDIEVPVRKCLDKGACVRVIAGEDFCLTDPDALVLLAKAGAQVRLFAGKGRGVFHPKVYLLSRGSEASLIVGSANLTHGALCHENMEAGVFVQGTIRNRVVQAAGKFFAHLWNNERSIPATQTYLERYRAGYERARRARAIGEDAIRIAEPEVEAAPERKPRPRLTVREMCRQAMDIGEQLHYLEIRDRVLRKFPEWEHGITPEASIRRDLKQWSVANKPADQALFGWAPEAEGLYTRLK